ncbi:uncharacterized protein LOC111313810 [Durio zibethinus]|uniref:Uncharacterized protein LOC111313810 n=1 Tax=Durio zibethinus TaxID=66656 RepID=A0A6P6AZF9_DURZI|nr:uncharacterized protein LOC111313810 [Durio zibethinus]
MEGKGRRSREKNYRAAHCGPARLPLPPDPSQVEALPSKLRKIISFTSDSLHGSAKASKERKAAEEDAEKKMRNLKIQMARKKLRRIAEMERKTRKERRSKYFEAKKKKHKNARTEENLDFPGRENIKFGDVVEASLKLVTVPKGSKTLLDASKERLRLPAIKPYRNRKGWTSRPGAPHLLPVTT